MSVGMMVETEEGMKEALGSAVSAKAWTETLHEALPVSPKDGGDTGLGFGIPLPDGTILFKALVLVKALVGVKKDAGVATDADLGAPYERDPGTPMAIGAAGPDDVILRLSVTP